MTTSLSGNIHQAFAEAQLSTLLSDLGACTGTIEARERELDELEQRIPLWDRINIFTDTTDEEQVQALRKIIMAERSKLAKLRTKIDQQIGDLATRYPPIELWTLTDTCRQLVISNLQTRRSLTKRSVRRPTALIQALERLAERILELYIPDLDLHHIVSLLKDEEACRAIAVPTSDVLKTDATLGYAPITSEQFTAMMAGQLLETGYFDDQKEVERLQKRYEHLAQDKEKARQEVKLIDDLNVFSTSPEEETRNQIAEQTLDAWRQWLARDEERQRLLWKLFDTYPPLTLHRCVTVVLGTLEALHTDEEGHISSSGKVEVRSVVAPRALVLGAAQNLRRAFLRIYPNTPMPSLLPTSKKNSQNQQKARAQSPRNQLMQEFTHALDRREGKVLIDQALLYAEMIYRLQGKQARANQKVKLLDRAIFWSNSEEQQESSVLISRIAHYKKQLQETWDLLLEQARDAGSEQAPLVIRDWTINASRHVYAIGTASPCSVNHHRNDAVAGLQQLKVVMSQAYGLRGTRQSFMTDIANQLAAPASRRIDPTVFRRRPYEEIVLLVSQPLRGTNYREEFARFSQLSHTWNRLQMAEKNVKGRISFWDWVNIFSETEAEQEHEQLRGQMKSLSKDMGKLSIQVNKRFDRALALYPPAQLYYMIDGVIAALQKIYAKMVTRTYTDSKGRTRTKRTCELYGKAHATKVLKQWNKTLLHGFGALPSYHDCLELWVGF